jgi:hypothetical protein
MLLALICSRGQLTDISQRELLGLPLPSVDPVELHPGEVHQGECVQMSNAAEQPSSSDGPSEEETATEYNRGSFGMSRVDDIFQDDAFDCGDRDQAENVYELEMLRARIPNDIDLTPHTKPCAYRNEENVEFIINSVVKPDTEDMLPRETRVDVPYVIDYDCDQVRFMIKKFTSSGIWNIDQFRRALGMGQGAVLRPQLRDFLKRKGPKEGARHVLYQLAWEFFKKVKCRTCAHARQYH